MVDLKILVKNLIIATISLIILLLAHFIFYVIPSQNNNSAYLLKEGELAVKSPPQFLYGFDQIYSLVFFVVFFFFIFYFVDKYKKQEAQNKSVFWKIPLIAVLLGIVYLLPFGILYGISLSPILFYAGVIGLILSFISYYKYNSFISYIFSIIGIFIVVEFNILGGFLQKIFCYSYWLSFKFLCRWSYFGPDGYFAQNGVYGPAGVEGTLVTFGVLIYFVLLGALISVLIKKIQNSSK